MTIITRYNLLDYHYAFDVVKIPNWDYNFQLFITSQHAVKI